MDPERPYCDVDGAIEGTPGKCISVACTPGQFETCSGDTALTCNTEGDSYDRVECAAGCDDSSGCRPFCTPKQPLACSDDQLMVCNAAGTGTIVETCGLGCDTVDKRCKTFEPSNGLGASLASSTLQPDFVLPPGTRIDTSTGVAQAGDGSPLPLASHLLPQANGPSILVIEGHSFVMDDVTVTGTNAIAFVAAQTIEIRGRIAARATASAAGPGASTSLACRGKDAAQYSCMCSLPCSEGTGGGGNATTGGRGGASATFTGGAAQITFSPLAGGCPGGNQYAIDNVTVVRRGGAGGGAVQLVAGTSVVLRSQGLIDVGAGGGDSTAGGGSGGTVIIESPSVTIDGPAAGVAANGGAGGGCGMMGPDGTSSGSQALGAVCPSYFAGSGGTGTLNPGNACVIGVDTCVANCQVIYGGGGGSAGRLRIVTKDGSHGTAGNPIISAAVTAESLIPK